MTRDPDVHSPEAGNDVHGQHDGTEDCELAEDVGSLLLSLVHADVDLCEVIAVGASENSTSHISMSLKKGWMKGKLTSHNGTSFQSW